VFAVSSPPGKPVVLLNSKSESLSYDLSLTGIFRTP
jgi:hypothetical protein